VRQALIAGCLLLGGCVSIDWNACPNFLFGGPSPGESCEANQIGKCGSEYCLCEKTDGGANEYVCNYPPDLSTIPDLGMPADLRSPNDLVPPTTD
jgi:hypothetical protein